MITDLIVDVDGTLVDTRHIVRRVLLGQQEGSIAEHATTAPPVTPVIEWVKAHQHAGTRVHILTARYEDEAHWTTQLLTRLGITADTVAHQPRGRYMIDTAWKRAWAQQHIPDPARATAIEDNPYVADALAQLNIPVILVPGWDMLSTASPLETELPEGPIHDHRALI